MDPIRLDVGDFGDAVASLHESLRKQGFQISSDEEKRKFFGPSTKEAVRAYQLKQGLGAIGIVDSRTHQALDLETLRATPHIAPQIRTQATSGGTTPTPLVGAVSRVPSPQASPPAGTSSKTYRVQGSLVFDYGLAASGITIRFYNIGFAGQEVRLGEAKTDEQGQYTCSFDVPQQQSPNLQARVVDANNKEIPISSVKFKAQQQEVLNLVVPEHVQPLAPEFQRLAADLERHIGGIGNLSNAQETAERQDFSLLHQSTGWDARLLALAANAVSLSQTTGLGQDVLYTLMRTGLPSDPQKLALVSSDAVRKALVKAHKSGIVSLGKEQIAKATTDFKTFASKTRLTLTAPGSSSTFGDFLSISGLNAAQQSAFADLFFNQASASDGLWDQAAGLGIPAESLNMMKLQGKLSYLTLNNAPLTQRLQQDIGSLDKLPQLLQQDLHTNTAWKKYLTSIAGDTNTEALDKLIPPAYQGKTTTDRLGAYADDLARKVRLSFPTHVVARMVEKGDLVVDAAPNVTTFLKNAAPLGFQMGHTPLNAFIEQQHESLFQGIAAQDETATTESVKTLYRLYQITPTNESLQAALKLGFTSAYDVAAFEAEDFVACFCPAFPSEDEARLFYRKAQQVNAITLQFSTFVWQLGTIPPLYAMSHSPAVREDAKAALIKQFPSLQSLFGSLDFCDCEECRSVLSPAAYLVDILRFIDPAESDWNSFLDKWKRDHHGKNYTDKYLKPYCALIEHRPDLPNLPLTCENTNTVLPYIDLVNEIFEYYIANGELDARAALDTGEAASADLLAEPQNILPAAYATLNGAVYPLGLPFDLWIQTVRRFLGYFRTSLCSLLEAFKATDPLELFSDSASTSNTTYPYYRAEILAEYLGISPAEYALLTDDNPLASWFKLYGYDDQGTALSALKSARTLSLRLGVSYQELVDLVKTGFLNPHLNSLVTLQKLGHSPEELLRYLGQAGYAPMTNEERKAIDTRQDNYTQLYNPSHSDTGFDAQSWLIDTWNKGGFKQILVLADPDPGCNFDQTALQYADGTSITPSLFLKLNLFVRLWKKLGWSLEETDRALQVFLAPLFPVDSDTDFGAHYKKAMRTALVYLAHLETLFQVLQPGANGHVKLLTFWSTLPTTGSVPLYAQLFLNASTVNYDRVFDSPTGDYLTGSLLINDHLPAIQGALHLTDDEIGLILDDAKLGIDTAQLSLENVSLLYRYGLLAHLLDLTVADFVDLRAMSGLHPFTPLSARPLAILADDMPLTQTLAFVDETRKVLGSGFATADLNYLLRHQFDPLGKYRPDPSRCDAGGSVVGGYYPSDSSGESAAD